MKNTILDSPAVQFPRPVWLPFLSMAVAVWGIFFGGWSLLSVAVLFWWELILLVASALFRMLFALEGQPFWSTFFQKIGLLFGGVVMGGGMIMLAVAFSGAALERNENGSAFAQIGGQMRFLAAAHAFGLVVHFLLNGRFRTASPAGELIGALMHLLVLLAFLMVLTMHLIPRFPMLDAAKWSAAAIVFVKFWVDWLFLGIRKPLKKVFTEQWF